MSSIKRIVLVLCFLIATAANAEQFVINKIQVVGLQRISLGTFLSYLPVKEGDRIDATQTSSIIRALYQTGFFNNVQLARKNGNLIISVVERPVIGSIKVSGNKKISKKQLDEIFKNANFVEGEVFDNSLLNSLVQSLTQQYYNMGLYNATIRTSVNTAERNRVTVNINIAEGPTAKIKAIHIIGNTAFTEKQLLKNFTLTTSSIFTWFSSNDQYSKEKLDADLEKLRSFYFDHGYLHFRVDSAQVSITPDKKHIYITIHVIEGAVYKIKGYTISGNLIGQDKAIKQLITLHPGDVFSRKDILDIKSNIEKLMGEYGYGMPDIKIVPQVDEVKHAVLVQFHVEPGHRVYIRRINFSGNTKTHDEVLRRELRQQEGALFSISKQEESKRRIQNLGYIQDVDAKIEPVPGDPDEVDLTYNVKETSSTSANFQVGYSDADGILYGISLNEQNFLGTGKAISLGFDNSRDNKTYNFSYYDPYFTVNNISMMTNIYAQKNTPGVIDLSSYSANIYGGTMIFGIPFSDYNRLNLGYGFEHIDVGTGLNSAQHVIDFTQQYGTSYNNVKLVTGWTYSDQDRAIFPTNGISHSLNINFAIPVGKKSVDYYTLDYNASYYYPIYKSFIFHARGEVGYGDGYGKTKELPFFKHFYCGGIDTVRGFQASTLGPLDEFGNPLGGNMITVLSGSIIFPNPVGDSLRTSVFADVGNAFDNRPVDKRESPAIIALETPSHFGFNRMRASVGVQGEWRSPLGPLVFSFAKPVNRHSSDSIDCFQFNIGTSF